MHEDAQTLVLAKPATLPMRPCGAYHFNSLFHDVSSSSAHGVHGRARGRGRRRDRVRAGRDADGGGGAAADGRARKVEGALSPNGLGPCQTARAQHAQEGARSRDRETPGHAALHAREPGSPARPWLRSA